MYIFVSTLLITMQGICWPTNVAPIESDARRSLPVQVPNFIDIHIISPGPFPPPRGCPPVGLSFRRTRRRCVTPKDLPERAEPPPDPTDEHGDPMPSVAVQSLSTKWADCSIRPPGYPDLPPPPDVPASISGLNLTVVFPNSLVVWPERFTPDDSIVKRCFEMVLQTVEAEYDSGNLPCRLSKRWIRFCGERLIVTNPTMPAIPEAQQASYDRALVILTQICHRLRLSLADESVFEKGLNSGYETLKLMSDCNESEVRLSELTTIDRHVVVSKLKVRLLQYLVTEADQQHFCRTGRYFVPVPGYPDYSLSTGQTFGFGEVPFEQRMSVQRLNSLRWKGSIGLAGEDALVSYSHVVVDRDSVTAVPSPGPRHSDAFKRRASSVCGDKDLCHPAVDVCKRVKRLHSRPRGGVTDSDDDDVPFSDSEGGLTWGGAPYRTPWFWGKAPCPVSPDTIAYPSLCRAVRERSASTAVFQFERETPPSQLPDGGLPGGIDPVLSPPCRHSPVLSPPKDGSSVGTPSPEKSGDPTYCRMGDPTYRHTGVEIDELFSGLDSSQLSPMRTPPQALYKRGRRTSEMATTASYCRNLSPEVVWTPGPDLGPGRLTPGPAVVNVVDSEADWLETPGRGRLPP